MGVRISAKNDRGLGSPVMAACNYADPATYCAVDAADAFIVPTFRPGQPQNAVVSVQPGVSSELRIDYDAPASDGGSEILKYRIEWSQTSDFGSAAKVDIDCPSNRAKEIVTVATSTTAVAGTLTDGVFRLAVTTGGVTETTLPIRFDALAMRDEEVAVTDSGIFCDPSPPLQPCDQNPVANPGSMHSHLEHLTNVDSVTVSRSGTGGVYTWTITFNDDGGDWTVADAGSTFTDGSGGSDGSVTM